MMDSDRVAPDCLSGSTAVDWLKWLAAQDPEHSPLSYRGPNPPVRYLLTQPDSPRPVSWWNWIFPADGFAVGEDPEQAPRLTATDFMNHASCGSVALRLRVHYVMLLRLMALDLDHHGWVMHGTAGPTAPWALSPANPTKLTLVARVLRMQVLAGWRGHSRSGYRDPLGFWYAQNFYATLQKLWFDRNSEPLPAQWVEAMRPLEQYPPGKRSVVGTGFFQF